MDTSTYLQNRWPQVCQITKFWSLC